MNKVASGKGITPYLRYGSELNALKCKISHLISVFDDWGAVEVEIPSLLNSKSLIDLYGEDLRSRAFVTVDPVDGEKILRPDFTVPIAEMHISQNKKTGRYSYAGPVWRSQPFGSTKPKEYYQVGLEYFHESSEASADAEIFNLFLSLTGELEVEVEIGDMGLLRAIVLELDVTDSKKSLLLRHLWRPDRFQKLLKQLSTQNNSDDCRKDFIRSIEPKQIKEYILSKGPVIGRRTIEEIEVRMQNILEEDTVKPIPDGILNMVEDIQSLKCPLKSAYDKLSSHFSLGDKYVEACRNLSNRIDAIRDLGINLEKIKFTTSFGRRSLEYYDGFIFSVCLKNKPGLPPVIQGGRYDALTKVLGKGLQLPAIGGIVRPEMLLCACEDNG